ncbi:LCP family protein [Micromonospora sp. NPDC049559]|uniref:LCP family protein n=1 Tax=Micromonospora sp. NPDC049559 TaxID=3155923 RepID=UPI003440FC8C
MIEDELRATFARHETLTPEPGPLRAAIDRLAVRRRRRRFALRAAGTVLAVLVTVSVPVMARTLAAAPDPPRLGGTGSSSTPAPAVVEGPLNFLVLGIDGEAGAEGNRADSVLMVHVPRDRDRIYLVALPRDLGVEIPGQGFDKLNSAFYYGSHRPGGKPDLAGGTELTAKTISKLVGVRFDGGATLTFTGLRRLTDAVGGVSICLDQPVRSVHTDRVFPAACQRLGGSAALDLLRQRYDLRAGAHDRDRNAERFAKALLGELASRRTLTDPARLSAVIKEVGDGLVLDTGVRALPELLAVAGAVDGAETVGIGWSFNTDRTRGGAYERLDPAVSRSLFEALRNDTLGAWVAANPGHVTR